MATAILAVAAVGSLTYQCHAVQHAETAKNQIAATRVAQLLIEDWKSTGGSDNYTPTTLGLGFEAADDFNADYYLTLDGYEFYVYLEHLDVATDPITSVTLRKIAATIASRSTASAASPADLPVGRVVKIDRNRGQLDPDIFVQPVVDLDNLVFVKALRWPPHTAPSESTDGK